MKTRLLVFVGLAILAGSGLVFSIHALGDESNAIPSWIKNNAKWWSEGQIGDSEFIKGIQYMVDTKILRVSTTNENQIENLKNQLADSQNAYSQTIQELNDLKSKYNDLVNQYNNLASTTQNSQPQLQTGSYVSDQDLTDMSKQQIRTIAQTNPLINGIVNGQIRFYMDPLPSYAGEGVGDIVQKFSDLLESIKITQLQFVRVYDVNDADIHISWIKNYGGETQGLTIFRSQIQVGLGSESCYGEWHAFDAQSVLEILLHEFGHSLGFNHSTDSNNIMYPYTDSRLIADMDKSITFNKGYLWHNQFCRGGTFSYQITTDDQYNGFDVYVSPPNSDYEGIISGKALYYPSCSKQNMISYSNTCTVEKGSTLWVYNHNDNPTHPEAGQVTIKIIDMNKRPIPDMEFHMSDSVYTAQLLDDIWKMFH